jgi:hypothetical protein
MPTGRSSPGHRRNAGQLLKAVELPKAAISVQPMTDGGSSCVNRLNTPVICPIPMIAPTLLFQDYIEALVETGAPPWHLQDK